MKYPWIVVFMLLACPVSQACHAQSSGRDLKLIADAIDDGDGDMVEPMLQDMRQTHPKDPEVLALLARIHYLRAVDGLSYYLGMPPMGWDRKAMDAAEGLIRQAVEADPGHANAWVIYGQIRYAQYKLAESLEMLERAESLDPASEKLRLRKGATLHALAVHRGESGLLDAAAREYSKVIQGAIDNGNERLAVSQLADIASSRNDFESAAEHLTKALAASDDAVEEAFLLDKRAKAYLFGGHVDHALADIRKSLSMLDFDVGRKTLAMALLVKSGMAMREGDVDNAYRYGKESFATGAGAEQFLLTLATYKETFPAVYALLEPRLKTVEGEQLVSAVLCNAAGFIGSDDLKYLKSIGANMEGSNTDRGSLLLCAIEQDNVVAVRTLLELGVDTQVRHPNGSTLLERTLIGTSKERKDIRRMVVAKIGAPAGWQDPDVDLPIKGRWYKAERSIGVEIGTSKLIPAGSILLADSACSFKDRSDVCLTFYVKPREYFGSVAIPLSRLSDLKAFQEVPVPVDANPAGK